jgi:hypothetical protein
VHEDMKWTYWPAGNGFVEMYQLDEDEQFVDRGRSGRLYICDYVNEGSWTVHGPRHSMLGDLPRGAPEEELKALAIAMWRLG